ncbi:MAG TPA: PilZ domain-containing protein [Candidatus Sulfotelmatobacter sp.]|nr:PilZ domain-containing protein [Candidatus Sulfotelmatobacter sp.]
MQGQIQSPPDIHRTAESRLCAVSSCKSAAAVELDARPVCVGHFFPLCIQELETRCDFLKGKPFNPAAVDSFKIFLSACVNQAQRLVNEDHPDDTELKGRLQDFLHRASQLGQHFRRSPRVASSVPIWLRREDPGRTWEEETWTLTVSRHGAGIVCHHPIEKGGRVVLCRRDRGSRAEARVVYCRFDSEGRRQIGVELLDRDDFWDPPKSQRHSRAGTRIPCP